MSIVKVTLPVGELPVNGKQVTFVAPCDCTQTEALQIEGENYTVVDALGNCVTGKGGKWATGAVVSVILDVDKKFAYLQNGNLTAEQVTLPNATATAFGLSNATADDAFRTLSKLYQHCWQRRTEDGKGEWEYLYSTSRDAYPDSGTVDGFEYAYAGVPFGNASNVPVKIETGSYTGTGTYGKGSSGANMSSLTFSFVPKIVFIGWAVGGTYSAQLIFVNPGDTETFNADYFLYASISTVFYKFNGNKVTWYSTGNDQVQNNTSGVTYNYLAIG